MTKTAERLRRSGLAAGVVTVFINTSRFSADPQYSNSVTFELAYSTDSTEELLGWALKGLEHIYRDGYRYAAPFTSGRQLLEVGGKRNFFVVLGVTPLDSTRCSVSPKKAAWLLRA